MPERFPKPSILKPQFDNQLIHSVGLDAVGTLQRPPNWPYAMQVAFQSVQWPPKQAFKSIAGIAVTHLCQESGKVGEIALLRSLSPAFYDWAGKQSADLH